MYRIYKITSDPVVDFAAEELKNLPPITVYESEITEDDIAVASVDVMHTEVIREGNKFFVEGEWLYNFMGQINFSDYESLNFFQRVLQKNGFAVMEEFEEDGVLSKYLQYEC